MKKHGKLLAVVLILILIFTLSGCNVSTTEKQNKIGSDKRVLDAIEVLSDEWSKEYQRDDTIEDMHLEIINTKIVNIKDTNDIDSELLFSNDGAIFANVDYIVEFELLSNLMNTTPYYFNEKTLDSVIVYESGKFEVAKISPFRFYRSKTYSNDFSPFIESIENLNGDYNHVIEMK